MEPSIASDWFTRTFDALYPVLYAHRSIESAAPEAEFAAQRVALTPLDVVLDLCCGNGRHLFHLRKRTAHLFGLDYSADLLRLASGLSGLSDGSDRTARTDRTRAAKPERANRLVRADMRLIPFTNAFDVVFNFFTSFGYFTSREDNLHVVRGVASALKNGGRFFIDYVNRAHVERNLMPESVRRAGPYDIHERRWIDKASRRVNKTTLVLKQQERIAETEESVQLYTLDEFRQLLADGGLEVDEVFGDFSGTPFDDDHPRMIVVGHKA